MALLSRLLLVAPLLHYAIAQMGGMPGMGGGGGPDMADMMKDPKMQEMMKDPAMMQEMMKMMGGGGMGGMGGGMMGGMPGMGGMGGGMMGGMPGMGGMGGGMPGMGGGQEQPPPPPRKEIGIKTARKFMKEVNAIISSEKAAAEIAEASVDKSDRQKHFQKIGPLVEKLVAGVTEKYKFEAGFAQAFQSVHEAQKRKDDPAVKAALEKFNKMIGMEPPVDHDVEEAAAGSDGGEAAANEEL